MEQGPRTEARAKKMSCSHANGNVGMNLGVKGKGLKCQAGEHELKTSKMRRKRGR